MKAPLRRALRPDPRTLASALLIVASFPPWGYFPLIWLALVPWFFALERAASRKAALLQGFWLGFLMTLGGFYWVAFVLREFAGLPWIAAITGLILFGLICQPQFLLFSVFQHAFSRKQLQSTGTRALGIGIALSGAYAGLDWALPKLFVDTLGHAFFSAPRLRQVADLGGAPLLTSLVYLVNLGLWQLLSRLKSRDEPSAWPALKASAPLLGAALGLAAAGWIYGSIRLEQVRSAIAQPRSSIQMGVIQANIGDFDKIAAEQGVRGAAEKILETFFSLSDQALTLTPRPDALVWPETSYPSTFRTPETTTELARDQQLERFVASRGVPLLFGGYDREDRKDFNAFFFLAPRPQESNPHSGYQDLQVYRKNVLLLFGEYIPGATYFKFLRDAFPQVGHFGRGKGPAVLEIRSNNPKVGIGGIVKTNPIICYEALFPNFILEGARQGSQMILNITNDSWFGPWAEPELHLALTTFRSVESRLPQLRSTNTGISALILPDGEITHPTALFKPEIMNVKVPVLDRPLKTLMLWWGDWYGPFALMAGFGGLVHFSGLRRLRAWPGRSRDRQVSKA